MVVVMVMMEPARNRRLCSFGWCVVVVGRLVVWWLVGERGAWCDRAAWSQSECDSFLPRPPT